MFGAKNTSARGARGQEQTEVLNREVATIQLVLQAQKVDAAEIASLSGRLLWKGVAPLPRALAGQLFLKLFYAGSPTTL